jgi:hypothetical protein
MKNTARAVAIPIDRSESFLPSSSGGGDAPHASTSGGITPEIMAVIEAAVTGYAGKNARIVSVKLVSEPQSQPSSWASHGLTVIHGSHNLVQRR